MEYEILEKIPSVEEYNQLRQSAGWQVYDRKIVEKALPNSLYSLCACVNGKIVGMVRIIGDDGLVYYIQDMLIKPDYRQKGIGTALMNKIMAYLQTHAGPNSIIGLMSSTGKEQFYERYGFVKRPTTNLGSGMTQFWTVVPINK